MKILVDNEDVLTLSETQKKVIKNDIPSEEFESDMKRRVTYIIRNKYERCLKRLKDEWEPKLKTKGVTSIPLDDEAFAEMVFSQSEYKNRSEREAEDTPK